MRFPKMFIFGTPIELGLVWYLLNSLKALASHGCPASGLDKTKTGGIKTAPHFEKEIYLQGVICLDILVSNR